MFSAGFISGVRDFTTYFHFWGVAHATFDRNFIHSADAFFLVTAHASFFYQKSRAQHTGSENIHRKIARTLE